jgi:hypothetical protein
MASMKQQDITLMIKALKAFPGVLLQIDSILKEIKTNLDFYLSNVF